jgi:hypothetical protein
MKSRSKRILFITLCGVLLIGGGPDAYAQPATEIPGELRTLTGRVRWKKDMGVPPKHPRGIYPTENICAHFFVVVTQPSTGSQKPIQYDIALEAKPEPGKPDYYSCLFDMKVPTNVRLSVHAGMGDGLAWPNSPQARAHYVNYWINSEGTTRVRSPRSIVPAKREVTVGKQGMYLSFELVYDQPPESSPAPRLRVPFIVASQAIFPTPFVPTGFVVLTWDAGPDHPNAEVWFKVNNSGQALFIKQPKGGQQLPVERGRYYEYILTDGGKTLNTAVFVEQ